MDKEWIHEQLRQEIPYLMRHECTPRLFIVQYSIYLIIIYKQ